MNANNKGLWDGFGSVTIYPVDPDPLGPIIPENAVQFNKKFINNAVDNSIPELEGHIVKSVQ